MTAVAGSIFDSSKFLVLADFGWQLPHNHTFGLSVSPQGNPGFDTG